MKIYIEGTITLDDDESTIVKFSSCNYDEGWNQWGNIQDKLWDTLPIVEKIDATVKENFFHFEDEDEE